MAIDTNLDIISSLIYHPTVEPGNWCMHRCRYICNERDMGVLFTDPRSFTKDFI